MNSSSADKYMHMSMIAYAGQLGLQVHQAKPLLLYRTQTDSMLDSAV